MTKEIKEWSIKELLEWGDNWLETKGIEQSRLCMEQLMAHYLGRSRLDLYLHFDEPLSDSFLDLIKPFIKRIAGGEPLLYILGETQFLGLDIKLNSDVLIPRSETEAMVSEIILKFKDKNLINILDIGTGSGCVALSMAKAFPKTMVHALDISNPAIKLAKENAKRNKIKNVEFIEKDMEIFFNETNFQYDLVISNPPYIPLIEYKNLDQSVLNFEPRIALTDNQEGIFFIELIFKQIQKIMKPNGKCFIEFGYNQKPKIMYLLEKYNLSGKIHTDIQNHPRFVEILK